MTKMAVRYLRIITTNKCNLRCYYCHQEGINLNDRNKHELKSDEIIELSKITYDLGFRKFKIMGGEPTLRKDLTDIIHGIRSFSSESDISLVTNGTLLSENIDNYYNAGLDRVNISLHGWFPERHLLHGGTQKTLANVKNAIEETIRRRLLTKINYVLLKNENESELLDFIQWAGKLNLTINILNIIYSPVNAQYLEKYHYTYDEIRNLIEANFDVVADSRVQSIYSLDTLRLQLSNGVDIRFKDSPVNKIRPFYSCDNCPVFDYCIEGILAIRLTEDGFVKPCLLRSDNYFNLFQYYKDLGRETAKERLEEYLANL